MKKNELIWHVHLIQKIIKSFILTENIDRRESKGDIFIQDSTQVYCKSGMHQGKLFRDIIKDSRFEIYEFY